MEPKKHKKNVADLYDSCSKSWENFTGGDHIHWGFYDPNAEAPKELSGHVDAQIRMIEEALRFAGFSDDRSEKWPKNILDVGCGLGGSSRYLAKKYGAKCRGITLSPYQVKRATDLTAAQGLADKVSFQVADATDQPFPDGQFDLVWSIECFEHVNEKRKFMSEVSRVAAPGATIIIVTFCRRALSPSEESLQTWEKRHMKKFSDSIYLGELYAADDYVKFLESFSLQDIKSADWTRNITQFSSTILRSFFTWKGLAYLWHYGLKGIQVAQGTSLLNEGMEKGLIKYAIVTCRKPLLQ